MFQTWKTQDSVHDCKWKGLIDTTEYWMNPEGEVKQGRDSISLKPEQRDQSETEISNIDDEARKQKRQSQIGLDCSPCCSLSFYLVFAF